MTEDELEECRAAFESQFPACAAAGDTAPWRVWRIAWNRRDPETARLRSRVKALEGALERIAGIKNRDGWRSLDYARKQARAALDAVPGKRCMTMSKGYQPLCCWLLEGHEGDHQARLPNGKILREWPREAEPEGDAAEPTTFYGLTLKCTGTRHPEQYDVFDGNEQVGYIRLKHGCFTAESPDCDGTLVYESEEMEGYGSFQDGERGRFLAAACRAIRDFIDSAEPNQAADEAPVCAYCGESLPDGTTDKEAGKLADAICAECATFHVERFKADQAADDGGTAERE